MRFSDCGTAYSTEPRIYLSPYLTTYRGLGQQAKLNVRQVINFHALLKTSTNSISKFTREVAENIEKMRLGPHLSSYLVPLNLH